MEDTGALSEAAKMELARRVVHERGRYYAPNAGLERFLQMVNAPAAKSLLASKDVAVFVLEAGNGIGKTALVTCLADYLSQHYANPYFDKIDVLRDFVRPNRGRVLTTANAAKIAYKDEREKWMIRGRFTAHKDGANFERRFTYGNRSEYDLFTFDQQPDQGESITLNWAITDEPMSLEHWTALVARFRFGGVIFVVMTPLEGSGWVSDYIQTPERLNKDVFALQLPGEEACIEHGIRGHLPHAYFEAIRRNCMDTNDLNARLYGKPYHLQGLVIKNFNSQYHVVKELPDYHQECYEKNLFTLYHVCDPHDAKAFAMGWFAVFPNEDVACLTEYPQWNFYREHTSEVQVPEYVKLIKDVEAAIGKKADVRIIDPNFGNAPKKGGNTVKEDFLENGMFFYDAPDSLEAGHLAIRKLLGRPEDKEHPIRSKYLLLEHCINHLYSITHYRYKLKANKDLTGSLSDKVTLEYKDHTDTLRYLLLYGAHYLHDAPKNLNIARPLQTSTSSQRRRKKNHS